MVKKKKILIVTDDAGESFEILYAQARFAEAGWQPVIGASKKKALHGVIHDFEPGWTTYVEKPGYRIEADLAIARARPADYHAVMLIGGRAPEHLRYHAKLIKFIREFQRRGKWIFSICHGVQILVAADIVKGRKLTCYENVRSEVTAAGGKWINRQSVVDGNLVTAQTWQSHANFYRDIFKCLGA
jgi:protease I